MGIINWDQYKSDQPTQTLQKAGGIIDWSQYQTPQPFVGGLLGSLLKKGIEVTPQPIKEPIKEFGTGFTSPYEERVGREFEGNRPIPEQLGRILATAAEATPFTAGIVGGTKTGAKFVKGLSKAEQVAKDVKTVAKEGGVS